MSASSQTALVDLNGKQYQVQEGRYLLVDQLPMDVDHTFEIANVLLASTPDNTVLVGAPYVQGASVTAKIIKHERGSKILVYKMRCKKGYRRKRGHRQCFTRIQIEAVTLPSQSA
jgi:large subunit ribosomal protein L21